MKCHAPVSLRNNTCTRKMGTPHPAAHTGRRQQASAEPTQTPDCCSLHLACLAGPARVGEKNCVPARARADRRLPGSGGGGGGGPRFSYSALRHRISPCIIVHTNPQMLTLQPVDPEETLCLLALYCIPNTSPRVGCANI
jgi:hypothetical protein